MAADKGRPVAPPLDLQDRDLPIDWISRHAARRSWFRIGKTKYPPIHFSQDDGWRFSSERIPGILYLGEDAPTCFWEVFWDDLATRPPKERRLDYGKVAERSCWKIAVPEEFRVINTLDAKTLQAMSAPDGTFQGPYANCQAWAEALHRHPSTPAGLIFRSARHGGGECLALFKDRVEGKGLMAVGKGVPLLQSVALAALIDQHGLKSLSHAPASDPRAPA